MFESLRKFSFQTTFGVDELASASSQLLNVGVSTHALQKDLKMLGDLAQGDKTKFQELTSIFAKVQSTGKATSMQIQQLALRGIPIIQQLKDMGVQGTASAEQLSKAFEKLTGEGGKFNNAMENINDTIIGKKGFIADTWKEILVNLGEITGLTDFWKATLDTVKDKLNDINEWLIRIKKLNDGGVLSREDNLADLQRNIDALEKQKAEFMQINNTSDLQDSSYTKKIEWFDKQIEKYRTELDALTQQEQHWQRLLQQSTDAMAAYDEQFSRFDNAKSNINNMYLQTDQGKREQELADYQDLLNMRNTGRRVNKILQNGMVYQTEEKLDAETLRKLNVVIAETEAKLFGTKETVKDLGKTWQEVFKDITGVTVKAKESGAEVAQRYIEGMHSDDISEQLNEILGITPDRLTQLKSDAEEIRKVIESLMSSETKAGDEYKWEDGSIQALINKYKELLKSIEDIEKEKNEVKAEDPFEKELQTIKDMLAYETDIYDTTVLRRIVEKEITEEQYKQLDAEQKKLDRLLKYRQLAQDKRSSNISTALGAYKEEATMHLQDMNPDGFMNFVDAVQQFCNGVGTFEKISEELQKATQTEGLDVYAKSTVANDAWGMMQGSEVGTFLQTFADTGNVFAGVISAVSQAFFDLLGGMEGVQMILNPIKEILQAFMPVIKTLLVPLLLLLKLLGSLANGIMKVLNIITFGLFSAGEKLYDSLVGLEESSSSLSVQQSTEVERLRQLNAQYAALKLAIKDQEEYYLKKRRELNADFINQQISAGLSVHDMILTPQGQFSTDPNDYIIATKNPQALGGGAQVNLIVNNSTADSAKVNVQQRQNADGFTELVINISKAVARDYANGTNGWNGAILARAQKGSGRSLS